MKHRKDPPSIELVLHQGILLEKRPSPQPGLVVVNTNNANKPHILTILPDLQANTLDLEVRVGNLEENSGDDGNSSIAELELRVEVLEDITADQETRIVAAESS